MKTFRFSLLLVSVLLLSAQCQKPEELDIKPKTRIIQKWARMGYGPYDPGNRFELWSDSTYKVYIDSNLVGDGTYSFYSRIYNDGYGHDYLYPLISMTGYYIDMWGWNINAVNAEYVYIRFIGDSACPPTLYWAHVPENLLDTIETYNLSNEILWLCINQNSSGYPDYYIKILN
jgi:hypothetical protein